MLIPSTETERDETKGHTQRTEQNRKSSNRKLQHSRIVSVGLFMPNSQLLLYVTAQTVNTIP